MFVCRVTNVTTNPAQQSLVPPQRDVELLTRSVELHLQRLRAWTALPDERTDWELEAVLEELGAAAQALRLLRSDAGVPF